MKHKLLWASLMLGSILLSSCKEEIEDGGKFRPIFAEKEVNVRFTDKSDSAFIISDKKHYWLSVLYTYNGEKADTLYLAQTNHNSYKGDWFEISLHGTETRADGLNGLKIKVDENETDHPRKFELSLGGVYLTGFVSVSQEGK